MVSADNEQMDLQRRSTTLSRVWNISFLNPTFLISFQICSMGFISGVYGGMKTILIFSGTIREFALCFFRVILFLQSGRRAEHICPLFFCHHGSARRTSCRTSGGGTSPQNMTSACPASSSMRKAKTQLIEGRNVK